MDANRRNVVTDPMWRAEDVGLALPDLPHACSVALPTWASVVGYEENDPAITSVMRAGYPRFFCHPLVTALFARAAAEVAGEGQSCLVFPTETAARRCVAFCEAGGEVAEAVAWMADGHHPWVVRYATGAVRPRLFWRFCGPVVSSRWAEALLERWPEARWSEMAAAGATAHQILRERLAALSGQAVEDVFLLASGMAAVNAAHRAVTELRPGAKTIQLGFPYVDALKTQESFGSGVHFLPGVGLAQLKYVEELSRSQWLAGIFCELPSNPLIDCVDYTALGHLALTYGVPLVADDTVATVINADAFRHADMVTTSLTKAFAGEGDVMAGCVILSRNSRYHAALRAVLVEEERLAPLWGADAVVLEAHSRDFPERVQRMNLGALAVVQVLAAHPAVAAVYHPSVRHREQYETFRRPDGGDGMLLSFVLRDPAVAPRVFDALRVCKGPSLGTNFTLACPYTLLAHYPELEWAAQCGVASHLIRVSVGLEAPADLVARFTEALALA
jgi:cystathionine gamma-synthase